MWFQLNTEFSTHLGALSTLQSNYGVTYSLSNFTKTTAPDMVKKDDPLTVVLTIADGATFVEASMTDNTNTVPGSLDGSTVTMTISEVKGPVTVIARATAAGSSGGDTSDGDDSGSGATYTFTVNPTPSTATVTLMKEEDSVVSNNAITVDVGDEVFYIVTTSNYVTVSGKESNITSSVNKNIELTAYGESGTTIPITWYPQEYYYSAATAAERTRGKYAIISPMDRVTTSNTNSNVTNHNLYWCTQIFTPDTLPNGSIITIADGYRYRPDGTTGLTTWNSTSTRPANVTTSSVVVDDNWWNGYSYVAFNVSNTSSSSLTSLTESDLNSIFSITLP